MFRQMRIKSSFKQRIKLQLLRSIHFCNSHLLLGSFTIFLLGFPSPSSSSFCCQRRVPMHFRGREDGGMISFGNGQIFSSKSPSLFLRKKTPKIFASLYVGLSHLLLSRFLPLLPRKASTGRSKKQELLLLVYCCYAFTYLCSLLFHTLVSFVHKTMHTLFPYSFCGFSFEFPIGVISKRWRFKATCFLLVLQYNLLFQK